MNMNTNAQYTFYLNQLYAKDNPNRGREEIEFVEANGQAEIRSFNQHSMKQILNVLLNVQRNLLMKMTFTVIMLYNKDVFALRIKNDLVLSHFKKFLKAEFIYLQQQEQRENRNLQPSPILSITFSLFERNYPQFKNKIIKIEYKYAHLMEVYTIDYQAAEEIADTLRKDIENFHRIDNSLIWIDIAAESRQSFVAISFEALQALEQICFHVSEN